MAPLAQTAFVVLMLLVGAARADEEPTAAAKKLFDSGRRHFDLAEYEAALDNFKEGYRLKDDPVFLYNIGLCHRLLGHRAEALRFFKNYLARSPEAPNHPDVERKIAALEDELASEARARAAAQAEKPPAPSEPNGLVAPASATPTVERPPLYRRWWLWTAVGGLVAVGVGVGLGVGLTRTSDDSGRYTFPRIQY